MLSYHNFILQHYHNHDPIDYRQLLDNLLVMVPKLKPMRADVSALLSQYRQEGKNMMFEGAQGTLLDIDHGHIPTSLHQIQPQVLQCWQWIWAAISQLYSWHHQGLHHSRWIRAFSNRIA